MDEETGNSSMNIDLPNGGRSYIIGNLIMQGSKSENKSIISYGKEGLDTLHPNKLYIVNNTIVNSRFNSTFIDMESDTVTFKMNNNLLAGPGTIIEGFPNPDSAGNIWFSDRNNALLVDVDGYDYRLTEGSPAIDCGVAPGAIDGFDLTPVNEYVHPLSYRERKKINNTDVGAYEFQTPESTDEHIIPSKPELEAFPNPFNEFVTLKLANAGKLIITDLMGNVVFQKELFPTSKPSTFVWKPESSIASNLFNIIVTNDKYVKFEKIVNIK